MRIGRGPLLSASIVRRAEEVPHALLKDLGLMYLKVYYYSIKIDNTPPLKLSVSLGNSHLAHP